MQKLMVGLAATFLVGFSMIADASAAEGIPKGQKEFCQANDNFGAKNLGQCIRFVTAGVPKFCKERLVPEGIYDSVGDCVSDIRKLRLND